MNYSENMPDWHQYNPTQSTINNVTSTGQNVSNSRLTYISSVSPSSLNPLNLGSEGLEKHQNDASNFSPRHFQPPNNIPNGAAGTESTPLASMVQMQACIGHYPPAAPRNSVVDNFNVPSMPRTGGTFDRSLNEELGYRNNQVPLNGPPMHHMGGPGINQASTVGPRSTGVNAVSSSRTAPSSYIPCKGLCCNPDPNVGYQQWDKYASYQGNVPYRDHNVRNNSYHQPDNRRYGNDYNYRKDNYDNKESMGAGMMSNAIGDHRRNFPDYKYRKDSAVSRNYPAPSGIMQNYPMQNYNYIGDYQKYQHYGSMKSDNAPYQKMNNMNIHNPNIHPKHQEQSYVQQKYNGKQMQYQNGPMMQKPAVSAPTANVISPVQSGYYNPQFQRNVPTEVPRECQENVDSGMNRMQPTAVHDAHSRYQMYQQKIAMQRYSMENHLREMARIPGYQTHPKYKECVLKYREILKLQQSAGYQSQTQQNPRVPTPTLTSTVPPINLQFDQNGVLINSNYLDGFSQPQHPLNPETVTEERQDKHQDKNKNQDKPTMICRSEHPSTSLCPETLQDQERFPVQKESFEGPTTRDSDRRIQQKISKEFANKPELDVRQFLANWDESEDEDGSGTNISSNVILSDSTPVVVVGYEHVENTQRTQENPNEERQGKEFCPTTSENQNHRITEAAVISYAGNVSEIPKSNGTPTTNESIVKPGSIIHCITNGPDDMPTIHIVDNLEVGSILEVSDQSRLATTEALETQEAISFFEENRCTVAETVSTTSSLESDGNGIKENSDPNTKAGYKVPIEDLSEEQFTIVPENTVETNEQQNDNNEVNTQNRTSKNNMNNSNPERNVVANLRKQNSFTIEESHNQDDISLPDLPTSECTPISTTLNTPIHSDNEESAERVENLSISTNPIEIIPNSPMISFTQSPVKMDPYEHLNNGNNESNTTAGFEPESKSNSKRCKSPGKSGGVNNSNSSEQELRGKQHHRHNLNPAKHVNINSRQKSNQLENSENLNVKSQASKRRQSLCSSLEEERIPCVSVNKEASVEIVSVEESQIEDKLEKKENSKNIRRSIEHSKQVKHLDSKKCTELKSSQEIKEHKTASRSEIEDRRDKLRTLKEYRKLKDKSYRVEEPRLIEDPDMAVSKDLEQERKLAYTKSFVTKNTKPDFEIQVTNVNLKIKDHEKDKNPNESSDAIKIEINVSCNSREKLSLKNSKRDSLAEYLTDSVFQTASCSRGTVECKCRSHPKDCETDEENPEEVKEPKESKAELKRRLSISNSPAVTTSIKCIDTESTATDTKLQEDPIESHEKEPENIPIEPIELKDSSVSDSKLEGTEKKSTEKLESITVPTSTESSKINETQENELRKPQANEAAIKDTKKPASLETIDTLTKDENSEFDGVRGEKKKKSLTSYFEDCDLYENVSGYVNPVFTGIDEIESTNCTVPVYTTKDGKITYSPNPKPKLSCRSPVISDPPLSYRHSKTSFYDYYDYYDYSKSRRSRDKRKRISPVFTGKRRHSEYSGYRGFYEPKHCDDTLEKGDYKNYCFMRNRGTHFMYCNEEAYNGARESREINNDKKSFVEGERKENKSGKNNNDGVCENYNCCRKGDLFLAGKNACWEDTMESIRSYSSHYDKKDVESNKNWNFVDAFALYRKEEEEGMNDAFKSINYTLDDFRLDQSDNPEALQVVKVETAVENSAMDPKLMECGRTEDICNLNSLFKREVDCYAVTDYEDVSKVVEENCFELKELEASLGLEEDLSIHKEKKPDEIQSEEVPKIDEIVKEVAVDSPESTVENKEKEIENTINESPDKMITEQPDNKENSQESFEPLDAPENKISIDKEITIENVKIEDTPMNVPADTETTIDPSIHTEKPQSESPPTNNKTDEINYPDLPSIPEIIKTDPEILPSLKPELPPLKPEEHPAELQVADKINVQEHKENTDNNDNTEEDSKECPPTLSPKVDLPEPNITFVCQNEESTINEEQNKNSETPQRFPAESTDNSSSSSSEENDGTDDEDGTNNEEDEEENETEETEETNQEEPSSYSSGINTDNIICSRLSDFDANTKTVPKLVIKKTDSPGLFSKRECFFPTEENSLEAKSDRRLTLSLHPKIPKMIIRNAGSRPGTPSVQEVPDEVPNKRNVETDTNERNESNTSSSASSKEESESESDNKPSRGRRRRRMKLEERISVRTRIIDLRDSSVKRRNVKKTVPKVKIKRINVRSLSMEGRTLRTSSADTNQLEKDPQESLERIPKLKLKKQESDDRSLSPEVNGQKRSSSLHEAQGKRHRKSSRENRSSSDKRRGSLDASECEKKDPLLRISEKIPKVIIKRSSASAEFKCEISRKDGKETIAEDAKWQPEVKLRRSRVLDRLVKDNSRSSTKLTQKYWASIDSVFADLKCNRYRSDGNKLSRSNSTSNLSPAKRKQRRMSDYDYGKISAAENLLQQMKNNDDLEGSSKKQETKTSKEDSLVKDTLKIKEDKLIIKTECLYSSDNENESAVEPENKYMKSELLSSFDDSVIKVDSSDDSQTTIEILPASPNVNPSEGHGRLYSEDAIPTQFELELEVTDNSNTDSLDVSMPKIDDMSYRGSHVRKYEESSSDTEHSEHEVQHYRKELKRIKVEAEEDEGTRLDVETTNNFWSNDSLIKEVLAAKETLKKCLAKSKGDSELGKKKQGSSFDLNDLTKSFSKTSNIECSSEDEETKESTALTLNRYKTESKSSVDKSEKKHSKQSKRIKFKLEEKPEEVSEASSTHRKDSQNFTTISLKSFKRLKQNVPGLSSSSTTHVHQEEETEEENARFKRVPINPVGNTLKPTEEDEEEEEPEPVQKTPVKVPKAKEDNMPVLEPEATLQFDPASDRDSSRSPPVITTLECVDTANRKNPEEKVISNKTNETSEKNTKPGKNCEMTITDIITQLAYHEKATIKHRHYCNLCERWFPTTSRHRRHLTGYQHRHIELTQRKSIHALFTLFTGKPCPRLMPANVVRTDCSIGELTPLQIAVQDVAKCLEHSQRSIRKGSDVGK